MHHLASGSRLYAAANATSMAAALAFATQDKASGVLSLDYPHLSSAAYPGTMPVYAAVPTSSLDSTMAKGYATSAPRPHTTGLTRGGTSWLARWTVLGLLGIGLLAGILVPLVRLAATPGHPVRVVLAGLRTRLVALRPHRTR